MTDPTKLPTQFNLKIPWDFKNFIADKAARDGTSQNKLGMDALLKAYGAEFRRSQREASGEPPTPEDATWDQQ